MSSGGAGSRVSIPNNVRQTIHHIREITGKQHTDEDIYTVLKECSMDPNETTQKLLFLDTFHVVQRKPRRKEVSNSKAPEDSRSSANTQGHGARGVRGNFSSQYISHDAGRNPTARRVNGVGNRTKRGPISPSSLTSQKTKNDAAPHLTKPTNAIPNGPNSSSNGSSSPTRAAPSSAGGIDVLKDGPSDANKDTEPPVHSDVAEQLPSKNIPTFSSAIEVNLPKATTSSDPPHSGSPSAPGVYSSASDPVLVPTLNSRHTSAVGSQRIVAEPNNDQVDKHLSHSENVALGPTDRKIPSKLNAEAKGQVSEPSQSSSLSIHDGLAAVRSPSVYNGQSLQEPVVPSTGMVESEAASANTESSSKSATNSNVSMGQHVTFPNHFQVPEALRSGLTFGSFDISFAPTMKSNGPAGDSDSMPTVESSQQSDGTAQKHPSNQIATSNEHEVDYPDHPHPTSNVLEKGPSGGNNASDAIPQHEQVKQDILLRSEVPHNPAIQAAANYSLGLMPQMLGSQLVQFEAPESQAQDVSRLPNFVGSSSPAISSPSPSPSPPVTQTAGVALNTIPMSPQPFPVFRQPYPPNYFPYGPYFSPFFVPPMHQYLGPNGFPQQPSAGNVYLPPAAAAGLKYSVPMFKSGPNPAHVGGYGSYSTSHVGYGPTPAVSSGSSSTGEDLVASQLKENHVYTTSGQLSEGSAVWFSAPGQDMSCLPVSSLYNIPPQVAYSAVQAGHGAYAGIYQPSQTVAAPSQAAAGGVETQSGAGVYQQPHAQITRNTNF